MKSRSDPFRRTAALATFTIALSAIPAHPADVTWTGASGADWDLGTNWSTSAKPATADTALFNLAGITSVTNATADQTVTGIKFDTNIASTGAFTLGTTGGNKLTLQNGGTIQILSTLTGTGKTITVNAPLVLAGTSYNFVNANTDATNTLNFGGAITSTGGTTTLTIKGANTGNNTISGNITNGPSGTMGVTKTDAGTWILSGAANTYGGTTTVSAGTLNLSGNLTTVGAIKVNGASDTVLNITGNLTQTVGGVRNFQLGATAGNTGTVNVSGSGILTLGNGMMLGENGGGNGTMNVSGGTVTTNGEIWWSGANSILNVSGGTFNGTGVTRIGGGTGTTNSTLTVSGSGSYISNTFDFGIGGVGATSTVNIGNGSVGGSLTLTGMTRGNGTNTINFNGGTLVANGNITTLAAIPADNSTFSTVVKSGGANISVLSSYTMTILTGLTDGTGGGGLTKSGSGTLTLSGTNTYTGATTLNQGTLTFGTGTLATTTGALSVNNTNTTAAGTNAILNLSTAADTTTGSLSGSISTPTSGTNTATINTQTGRTLTVNQTTDGTYAGVIAGTGNFTLGSLSTNTLTLTGTNTYTGTTTINAGTLALGHATDTLSSSSAVTVDGATSVLSIAGNSDTVGAVSLKNGGSITGSGGTLTGASYAVESGSVSANLGGAGIALTKSTSGTVTLSGTNTYSGATTINAGKLLFSRGNSSTSDYSGTGAYSIASGATLEINGTGNARFNTSNNQFTGAGTFIKSGSGRTFLTAGTNTQSFNMSAGGLIDVQAGTLDTSARATNLASLNIASGAQLLIANTDSITTLQFDALTGGGTLNMVGTGTRTVALGANGGSGTFSGVINNTGTLSLTKTGAGTQILSGANTYTGATTVSQGTLLVNGSTAAGSTVGVSVAATLGGNGTVGGATTFTGASIHAPGSAAATVGTQTFSSTLAYGSGTIFSWDLNTVDGGDVTDPGEVSNAATGTYDKVTAAGAVTGGAAVFKVVLAAGDSFTHAFWDSDKSWTDIFGGAGAPASLAAVFSGFDPSGGLDSSGVVTGEGHFSFSGASLNWTVIPEPTSALAGLLLTAGLLRRRRTA